MPPEVVSKLSSEGALAIVLVVAFLQSGVQITTSLINFFQKKRRDDEPAVLLAISQLASAVSKLTDTVSRVFELQEHNEGTLASVSASLAEIRTSLATINTKLDFIITNRGAGGGRGGPR